MHLYVVQYCESNHKPVPLQLQYLIFRYIYLSILEFICQLVTFPRMPHFLSDYDPSASGASPPTAFTLVPSIGKPRGVPDNIFHASRPLLYQSNRASFIPSILILPRDPSATPTREEVCDGAPRGNVLIISCLRD